MALVEWQICKTSPKSISTAIGLNEFVVGYKKVQIFRYRESVIGDCLNLHQIDGKMVETNSRILMKNLQKAKHKQSSTSSSLTSSSLSNSTSKNLSSLNGEEISSANEDEPS